MVSFDGSHRGRRRCGVMGLCAVRRCVAPLVTGCTHNSRFAQTREQGDRTVFVQAGTSCLARRRCDNSGKVRAAAPCPHALLYGRPPRAFALPHSVKEHTMPATRRAVQPDDLFRVVTVPDAQVSPDGRRVAVVKQRVDVENDTYTSAIWLIDADGANPVQLTAGTTRDTSPRWSPD